MENLPIKILGGYEEEILTDHRQTAPCSAPTKTTNSSRTMNKQEDVFGQVWVLAAHWK